MKHAAFLFWLLAIAPSALAQEKPAEECAEAPQTPGIMSVTFANEKRDEAKLQRLFIGTKDEFAKGHLPRSAMLDLAWIRGEVNGIKSELLPPKEWAAKLGEQGIDSRYFVLIHANRITDATLAGWALTTAGFTQWYILDGGLGAWKAAGLEIETGGAPGLGTKATFAIAPTQDAQAKIGDVMVAAHNKSAILLDARPPEQLAGGFLRGAINVPWPNLLKADGTFKPIPELRKLFADAGIREDKDLIVYCNSGHQASTDYFALRYLLGMKYTRIWDGSMAEWKMDPARPIERP